MSNNSVEALIGRLEATSHRNNNKSSNQQCINGAAIVRAAQAVDVISPGEIVRKAANKALGGGIAGAGAMAVQVRPQELRGSDLR